MRVENAARIVEALGGPDNIVTIAQCVSRVRVGVVNMASIDEATLRVPEILAVVRSAGSVHLITGVRTEDVCLAIARQVEVARNSKQN